MVVPVLDVVTKSPFPVSPTSNLTTGAERYVTRLTTKTNAVKSYQSNGMLYRSPVITLYLFSEKTRSGGLSKRKVR